MATNRKRELGFFVELHRRHGITEITAEPVYKATAADTSDPDEIGAVFNPRFDLHRRYDVAVYEGFRVAGYVGDRGDVFGVRHEYHARIGFELDRSEAMTRTLRRIDKVLRATSGRADRILDLSDFTTRLLTVAEIIDARFFAYRFFDSNATDYTDAEGIPSVIARILPVPVLTA